MRAGGRRIGMALATLLALSLASPAVAFAQTLVLLDSDDTNEDGVADKDQSSSVPTDGLHPFTAAGVSTTFTRADGVRLIDASGNVLSPGAHQGPLFVQGVRAGDAALEHDGQSTRFQVIAVRFLNGLNEPIDPTTGALGLSHRVTNDASLPRGEGFELQSGDADNFRVEVRGPTVSNAVAQLESVDVAGAVRARLGPMPLSPGQGAHRSRFVRLVGDAMDQAAPGVSDHVLRTQLRDTIRVRVAGSLSWQALRFGRPGSEDGPTAARRGRLVVHIMRVAAGGIPVVGGDDAGAIRLGQEQVRVASEIWQQCFLDFGPPEQASVIVHDPPPAALLAISDSDGLPATGGGEIRFQVNGQDVGPIPTEAGAAPWVTALSVARALTAAGFQSRVSRNARIDNGAMGSADVVVRDAQGALARLTPSGSSPLSSDSSQRVAIGALDLSDGLQEFSNMTAAAGTLEERAMMKTLMDDDPSSVDLFVINSFSGGGRQGEAFIEADDGAIINAFILDRNGMRQQRHAWTQSHELGHVILNDPLHPDNVGPDRPYLLMDADASAGIVTGPKRLSWAECRRARYQSGLRAQPSLMSRHPD